MRLGIHTSISGGFDKAVKRLSELGCNTCQMFSRSPRGGRARVLSQDEISKFRDLCRQSDIDPVVVHIPYVLNLATSDEEMHKYAVSMVKEDMERADALGAAYLVLHMGSHRGQGMEKGLAQVSLALNRALENYAGRTMLLLENTAGAGSEVGNTFEQLVWVLGKLQIANSAGICFDTCHGFAAGYDLSGKNQVEAVFADIDRIIGLSRLKLIHANDALFPLGSKKDRHAHIGSGHIGEVGFHALLHHPGLKKVPIILETPADTDADWEKNIQVMKKLAEIAI